MKIKLVAIDIDGTLLNRQRQLTTKTIKAVKQARAAGNKIVLTTGRPLRSTQPFLRQLALADQDDQYVINYHGALISTTAGQLISAKTIPFKVVQQIAAFIQAKANIDFIAQSQDEMFLTKADMNYYTAREAAKNHYPTHFRSVNRLKGQSIYKVMFSGMPPAIDQLQTALPSWLEDEVKAVRTEKFFIDMTNKEVSKGWAVRQLSQKLGLKAENVLAIGDGNSDRSMIKFAGLGVAMGNATAGAKAAAQVIAPTNEQEGVARVLQRFVL